MTRSTGCEEYTIKKIHSIFVLEVLNLGRRAVVDEESALFCRRMDGSGGDQTTPYHHIEASFRAMSTAICSPAVCDCIASVVVNQCGMHRTFFHSICASNLLYIRMAAVRASKKEREREREKASIA